MFRDVSGSGRVIALGLVSTSSDESLASSSSAASADTGSGTIYLSGSVSQEGKLTLYHS